MGPIGPFRAAFEAWVKPGWGARFASAFEAVGADDCKDLACLSKDVQEQLLRSLEATGAKLVHIHQISNALAALAAQKIPAQRESDWKHVANNAHP